MALTMHDTHATPVLATLRAILKILDKAAAFCQDKKIEESALLNYRLAPDMFVLSRQIQVMTDMSRRIGMLAGDEYPSAPDTETTIDQLRARINAAITYISGLDAKRFAGVEDREITMKMGGHETKMKGLQFGNGLIFPNFYFHAATAYDILRHAGVPLGKRDFLGM
jgi:uncharacterized protein